MPAAAGIKMTLVDQQAGFSGLTVSVDGTDTGTTSGFDISGRTSHEFIWKLTSSGALPEGVYGVLHQVHGGPGTKLAPTGDPFGSTPWLLSVYATPGFDPDPLNPNVDLAAREIYAAAVPEPTSIAMLGGGLALAVTVALRRRRRGC